MGLTYLLATLAEILPREIYLLRLQKFWLVKFNLVALKQVVKMFWS